MQIPENKAISFRIKKTLKSKAVVIFLFFACLFSGSSFAQEENQSDILKITVTGTKSRKKVKDYAGSVDVINKIDFDQLPSINIRNLFRNIPGVTTVFSTRSGVRGTPGITDVNIRGLDGNQILFLIDGIRLPERYEYGDYYTLGNANYIDFSTLKSVEIIKGSASSLYGSDALGGLVSYTTMTPDDILQKDSNFNIEIPINYTSENNGTYGSIKPAIRLSENISTLFIYTNEKSNESQVLTAPEYLDQANNTGNNYFSNTQLDFNEYSKVNIVYENLTRKSQIESADGNLALMSTDSADYKSLTSNTNISRKRFSAAYKYEGPSGGIFDKVNLIASRQFSNFEDNFNRKFEVGDKTFRELKDYDLTTDMIAFNAALTSTLSIGDYDHILSYGFDISESDGSRTRRTKDLDSGKVKLERDTPDAIILRSGIYLQDQITIDEVDIVAGVRYDRYSINSINDSIYNLSQKSEKPATDQIYDVFSPSLSLSYSPSESTTIYARYSNGFRPPSWYEVNSSFSNPQFGYETVSNPDLRPETSNDYEIGLKLNLNQLDLTLASYYNYYTDLIDPFVPVKASEFFTVYQTRNIAEAEIYGIEFTGKYYFTSNREGLYISNVLACSEGNNLKKDIPIETVIPFTNRLSIGYTGSQNLWSISAGLTYVGQSRLANTYEYFIPPSYLVADMTANFQLNNSLSINASLNNLTNQRYYNFQDVRGRLADAPDLTKYSYPERNLQIGIRLDF